MFFEAVVTLFGFFFLIAFLQIAYQLGELTTAVYRLGARRYDDEHYEVTGSE